MKYFHSVTLDEEKCKGCTNCIKHCPTEAIRVRDGKAIIIKERCIDCGECIRVCPYHAKMAVVDEMEKLNDFKIKVGIPAPSFYAQFTPNYSIGEILGALKQLYFDYIYEVARGAEITSYATLELLKKQKHDKPLISAACPAVVRLIQVRFPSLIDSIIKVNSPMEISAAIAKRKACKLFNVNPEDVGVFFISPCAAKATSIKAPLTRESSNADGVFAAKDLVLPIYNILEKGVEAIEPIAGNGGVGWAAPGGEGHLLEGFETLSVDGIHNVIKVLEQVEDGNINNIDYIEAMACTCGCLGGPLNVVNPYIALKTLEHHVKSAKQKSLNDVSILKEYNEFYWDNNIIARPVLKLDSNINKAIEKLEKLEAINAELPGLDCGACGAPSCRALAEDIVRGISKKEDCIFELRNKVKELEKKLEDKNEIK